ncbi:30S ribosomal protein S12 methylthiotransferase RimO [candidate division TA06 bacterium]|nr:30S ribosomal protein S12 methylthiotransferase RimO [candidate division TA06 bacterium]
MSKSGGSLPVPRAYIVSLGCSKNRVDTEIMIGQLIRAGYQITGMLNQADAVIVNTCGFLQESVNEALAELAALAGHKKKSGFRLVATGCLVQRMEKELLREVPEIDALVGVHGYKDIVSAVTGKKKLSVSKIACDHSSSFYRNRIMTTGPGWAYLRIADGCDNNCSYCLIPKIRGRFRSRKMGEIIAEANILAGKGVKEINLIAQDTTNYGLDLYGERMLGDLLLRLDKVKGLEWIRLLYTHPAHYDQKLIRVLKQSSKTVKYLDIPLQHSQSKVLKAMNRGMDQKITGSLISELRQEIPKLAIRTTFMTGFPGETETDFNALLDFVSRQKFEKLGAFAFSPEPGTKASMLSKQVSRPFKQSRLHELMALQRNISGLCNRSRIGQGYRVLVEGPVIKGSPVPYKTGYSYYGRSYAEAPEVDGKVYIKTNKKLIPGNFVKVRINKAWIYDLGGTLINDHDWIIC